MYAPNDTVIKKKKSFRIDYSCNGYKQADLPHKRYDYSARLIHWLSDRAGISGSSDCASKANFYPGLSLFCGQEIIISQCLYIDS